MKSTFDLPPWFWLPLGLVGGACFALAFYGTARWLDRPEPAELQTRRLEPPVLEAPPAAFAPQPEMPDGTEQALSALARQGAQIGKEALYGEPARRWARNPPKPPAPKPAAVVSPVAPSIPPAAPSVTASAISAVASGSTPSPFPPLPSTAGAVLMEDFTLGAIDAEGPPDRAQEARFVLTDPLGTVAAGSTVYAVPRLVDTPAVALPVHFYAVRVETGTDVLTVPFGHWVLMEPGDRPVWVPAVPAVGPSGANPIEREIEPQFQLAAGRNLILQTVVPWNP
ncbi:MAG: hypothetical protein SNJ60_05635 [Pseudanabaenaceae cyanobacterium]